MKQNINNSETKHHYVRTAVASVFGTIALLLVLASFLVVWVNRTLTDTDTYINTVKPLITTPQVQNFFADKINEEVQKKATIQELGAVLLPQGDTASKSPQQIQVAVDSLIKTNVTTTLNSPEFKELWENINRSAHKQFIRQIQADHTDTIKLDLSPAVVGLFRQMTATDLAPLASSLDIPADAGNAEFKGTTIQKVHDAYEALKKGTVILILITLIFVGASVWASVHHVKTLRRIAFGTGLILLSLGLILSLTSVIKIGGSDPASQELASALIGTLTHTLQVASFVIGGVLLVGSVSSKLYQKVYTQKIKR